MAFPKQVGQAAAMGVAVAYSSVFCFWGQVSPLSRQGSAVLAMSIGTAVCVNLVMLFRDLVEMVESSDSNVRSADERLKYMEIRMMNSEMEPYECVRQISQAIRAWKPQLSKAYAARQTVDWIVLWMRSFTKRYNHAPADKLVAWMVQLAVEQGKLDTEKSTMYWESLRDLWGRTMLSAAGAEAHFAEKRVPLSELLYAEEVGPDERTEMCGHNEP